MSPYILSGGFYLGMVENIVGGIVLDELSKVHKGDFVGYSLGLLHVMRNNDDGILRFQFKDQVFDFTGADRIQRGARFVHQDDFWSQYNGPGYTQALLLTASQFHGWLVLWQRERVLARIFGLCSFAVWAYFTDMSMRNTGISLSPPKSQ